MPLGSALGTPLQMGIPGGPELLVVLFVVLFFFVPVGAGALLVVLLLRQKGGADPERVAELEARVEELESELEGRG